MNFYIILFLITLVSSFAFRQAEIKLGINITKYYLFIYSLFLGVISGIRGLSVGTDTQLYARIFYSIGLRGNSAEILHSKYPVYELYNLIIYSIKQDPRTVIFLNAIITIFLISIALYRLSPNVYMSSVLYITLYFYPASMNTSRQFLAVAVVLLAVTHLFEGKSKLYLVLTLLATFIHSTAVVALVFLIIRRVEWNIKKLMLFSMISTVILASYSRLIQLFIYIFPVYRGYVESDNGINISSESEGNKIYLTIFYFIFLVIGWLLMARYKDKLTKEFGMLTATITLAVLMGLLFSKNILIDRVSVYFTIMVIIYIPYVIKYSSKIFYNGKIINFLFSGAAIGISLIPFIVQLGKNVSGVIPYIF